MPPQRLFVLIAGNFFVATSFLSVGGLLSDISVSLSVPIEKAGLLIAAFGIAAAICAPTLATLGSRIDRRKLLTGSMAVCALANMLAALSQTYDHLLLARVLAAVTSAVYTPQLAATMSMLTPEKERAPMLAKLMVGWSVGVVAGNPLAVLIASVSSWRMSFAFIGVSSAIIAMFVWRSLPDNVMVPPLNWHRWFQVLRSPALRWLTVATALTNVGSSVMASYIAPIVKAVQGISGPALALLLFVCRRRRPAGKSAVRTNGAPIRRHSCCLPLQPGFRDHAAAVAIHLAVGGGHLRDAILLELGQRGFSSRAAGEVGCRRAHAGGGDHRLELVGVLSGNSGRRQCRRERLDGGAAAIHDVGGFGIHALRAHLFSAW